MLLDVSKYVFTIVVIGGLAFGRLDDWVVAFGIIFFCAIMTLGVLILPEEEKWE